MVIDDEQMIRETLSKFLSYQGHEVTTAVQQGATSEVVSASIVGSEEYFARTQM